MALKHVIGFIRALKIKEKSGFPHIKTNVQQIQNTEGERGTRIVMFYYKYQCCFIFLS